MKEADITNEIYEYPEVMANEFLKEAHKVLLFAYNSLCNMTTDEFSKGGDREIRRKIAEYLDIEEQNSDFMIGKIYDISYT